MLSKKYYEEFAKMLSAFESKEKLVQDMINYFKWDKPNFNESKFREACEWTKMSQNDQVIKEAQELVNELKTFPMYRKFVEERKLKLFNSELALIDDLLEKGILK